MFCPECGTQLPDDSMVNFDGFFMNADGTAEYAIGTFDWISGERCRIGLVRNVS